jgi:hypothetical protein
MLPPLPLTEPDVQISSFRFFTGEFRSRHCSDGRSGLHPSADISQLGTGASLVVHGLFPWLRTDKDAGRSSKRLIARALSDGMSKDG